MHVGPRNIALFSALNMSASAMNNNNLVKNGPSVCSDNNCTQPRAKNQIRCKDCRNQFQAFRSSVVRFYRNDACVPPSDSSCFRRFVKEKPQWEEVCEKWKAQQSDSTRVVGQRKRFNFEEFARLIQ